MQRGGARPTLLPSGHRITSAVQLASVRSWTALASSSGAASLSLTPASFGGGSSDRAPSTPASGAARPGGCGAAWFGPHAAIARRANAHHLDRTDTPPLTRERVRHSVDRGRSTASAARARERSGAARHDAVRTVPPAPVATAGAAFLRR